MRCSILRELSTYPCSSPYIEFLHNHFPWIATNIGTFRQLGRAKWRRLCQWRMHSHMTHLIVGFWLRLRIPETGIYNHRLRYCHQSRLWFQNYLDQIRSADRRTARYPSHRLRLGSRNLCKLCRIFRWLRSAWSRWRRRFCLSKQQYEGSTPFPLLWLPYVNIQSKINDPGMWLVKIWAKQTLFWSQHDNYSDRYLIWAHYCRH